MMKASRSVLSLAGALLVAAQLPAQQADSTLGTPKETTLSELVQKPSAYKNVWVVITGTFAGVGELHNPFFTRFTRANHVNFALWGDDAKLWVKEDFDKPCPTLFVDKLDDETTSVLYKLPRYQRVKLTGVVRNAFQGKPWIEITKIERLQSRFTTASLRHLHRAHNYIGVHEWQKAGVELGLAQAPDLPQVTRGWIDYYRGVCLMRVGKPKQAMAALQSAKTLLGNRPELDDQIAVLGKDPKSQIDEVIRKPQIAKSKRPFWEAVEKSKKEKAEKPSTPAKPAK